MLLTLGWIALGVAALWAATFVIDRRDRAVRLTTVRAEWGRAPVRDRDMVAIGAYQRARAAADPEGALDERTWSDLNMNDVFSVLDRTESVVGQQVLYPRLRATPRGEHLEAFEALVTRLSEDARARERAQLALGRRPVRLRPLAAGAAGLA